MEQMQGKACVITGANSGIGKTTAEGLARKGARVVIVCRDETRGKTALADVRNAVPGGDITLKLADLASFDAIRNLAHDLHNDLDRLDVLINNAAIVPATRQETHDGIEMQFGVNHLGPFLLTHLLLDMLQASAPARIVNVASTVHYSGTIDFNDPEFKTRKYGALKAYNQSKLANVLFTFELARRLEGTGVSANCLHPGVVRTNITRAVPLPLMPIVKLGQLFMISPQKGAQTNLYLAASPQVEGVSGKYFDNCKEKTASVEANDPNVARRLWELSAEMTGIDALQAKGTTP